MKSATTLALNLSSFSSVSSTYKLPYPIFVSPTHINGGWLKVCAQASISRDRQAAFDPGLNLLRTELYELERILFSPSYFSPLPKSVANRTEVENAIIGEDLKERETFIAALELVWQPSYRNVLLEVRKKLNVPCLSKLLTEDLEVDIFLHLLQDSLRFELHEHITYHLKLAKE